MGDAPFRSRAPPRPRFGRHTRHTRHTLGGLAVVRCRVVVVARYSYQTRSTENTHEIVRQNATAGSRVIHPPTRRSARIMRVYLIVSRRNLRVVDWNARAGAKSLFDARADLPIPLLHHAQDASGDARSGGGGVSRRLRHTRRVVRSSDPRADAQGPR